MRVLPRPAIVLVTRGSERAVLDVVHAAVHVGISAVQLRAPELSHDAILRMGAEMQEVIGDRALFFVNGDARAAAALHADGLHLPEAGMSVAEARAMVAAGTLISRAVHSIEAAERAEGEGADILQAGTLFETRSKPRAQLLGIEGLRAICGAVARPVIAIGGVTPANAGSTIAAGAAGIAVIGAIMDARDVRSAVQALRAAVDAAA